MESSALVEKVFSRTEFPSHHEALLLLTKPYAASMDNELIKFVDDNNYWGGHVEVKAPRIVAVHAYRDLHLNTLGRECSSPLTKEASRSSHRRFLRVRS